LEHQRCLVFQDTLNSELLENLLEGGLADGVLGDVEFFLFVFDTAEEEADRLVVAGQTELEEVAALLD